jgi:hypothetical protein
MVHLEDIDRCTADGSSADKRAAFEAKVIMPLMPAGMLEPGEVTGGRVEAAQVRPFVDVAVVAGQGEVAGDRAAAMLAGNDVVELEGNPGPALRQVAILATPGCPFPYQAFGGGVHSRNRLVVLFEGQTGLGVHKFNEIADAEIALELGLLGFR